MLTAYFAKPPLDSAKPLPVQTWRSQRGLDPIKSERVNKLEYNEQRHLVWLLLGFSLFLIMPALALLAYLILS